jgi:hypothetical protein
MSVSVEPHPGSFSSALRTTGWVMAAAVGVYSVLLTCMLWSVAAWDRAGGLSPVRGGTAFDAGMALLAMAVPVAAPFLVRRAGDGRAHFVGRLMLWVGAAELPILWFAIVSGRW